MPHNSFTLDNSMAGVGMATPYMDTNEPMSAISGNGILPSFLGAGGVMQSCAGNVTPMVGVAPAKFGLYEVHQQIQHALADYGTLNEKIEAMSQRYNFLLRMPNKTEDPGTSFQILITEKTHIVSALRTSFLAYEGLQELVINELKNWRRQQALAGNGAPFNENALDDIQRCYELLEVFVAHLLAGVRATIRVQLMSEDITDLLEHVQCAQKTLVCSAFIVDKQPPQVMKTHTRFAASVRWLIGSQLGIHMNPPTVECIIMSELQAHRFVTQRTHTDVTNSSLAGQSSGEILNCSSTMEFHQSNQVFSASFRNMQLKKIKRAEKKGTESVMDEKFALFFYATTTVNDYQIRVWTLSLPVVVIVHGNQEPQSWATITWDNAFAEIVRDPFMVTDRVTWKFLSIALNTKFGSSTQRALTVDNLSFIYEKLHRDRIAGEQDECITWNQFCKEPLPDRSFTFWEWFFNIMKLTKDHLLSMWKAGRITGFINKQKAQEDLIRANTGVGTFLLRFSDSELGGVTIAYVNQYGTVTMLSPWTAKDLQILNLADRIRDLDMLRVLHPTDISVQPMERDSAFGDFYTHPERSVSNGYVGSKICVHVNTGGDTGSIIGTPHHSIQSPQQDSMSIGNMSPQSSILAIDDVTSNDIVNIIETIPCGDPLLDQISYSIYNAQGMDSRQGFDNYSAFAVPWASN